MVLRSRWFALLVAVLALLMACAGRSAAQAVIVASPPVVRCYTPPAVSYYSPPVVSYYSPPAVSYYAPPVVSYYSAPVVSYYSAPAVVASPATTVTTYRYGLLPRRRVTVQTYVPPPTYYSPMYVGP
jgi:hypothetical protein